MLLHCWVHELQTLPKEVMELGQKEASDQLVADEPKGTHVRGLYGETDEALTTAVQQRVTALHVSHSLSLISVPFC